MGFSFCVRDGSKFMIAGVNKSGKYGAELKFSVKSIDLMKVMVKIDSKSSNDALYEVKQNVEFSSQNIKCN